MKTPNFTNIFFFGLTFLTYCLLTIICWNHGYFWDNIQLTSIEAHWYYLTDFKALIVPKSAPELGIYGTVGPPLLPLVTAFLWKTVAYKVWVSHALIFLWAIVLIYNTWKLVTCFFLEKYVGWVSFIILMETTLLAQFSIAPPDFILFTAFVISLRAIFERKNVLLAIGFLFLLAISMRGFFTGTILFVVHGVFYFYSKEESDKRTFFKTFLPYLPAFLILIIYFSSYFITQGWFFTNSKFAEAHNPPTNIVFIIRHLCDLGMRLIENGRIIIWLIAIFVAWKMFKTKTKQSKDMMFILSVFILLTGLYLLFSFITKMPFLTRYFMPHILLLTIFALVGLTKFISEKRTKYIFILILCFELTGHFWIYPEKTTVIWDSTLAHLPYYELREECFDYIDKKEIDYNDISAGFSLYDDRRFVELDNIHKVVGRDNRKLYFIYSNVSNIPDEWIDDFRNTKRWAPIKSFQKGFVIITIYKNLHYSK